MEAAFRTSLIVQDDFGLPYVLYIPLVYDSALLNQTIVVDMGFDTDLASIPAAVWGLLAKSGRYDRAAVVHDWLYRHNGVTRGQADSVLNEAMGVLKVNGLKRRLIYWAVRAGGWKGWNRYRRGELVNGTAQRTDTGPDRVPDPAADQLDGTGSQ